MLISIIGIVVLLGGLIFFHELGHYLIAKLFNVKVEIFSLGFGKKIFSRKVGETEYCLSLFPLGGYVKLMGDDPYKEVPAGEAERAFSTQKLYKRFLIVAAGPIFNLILAYALFVVVFWTGLPTPSTRIGEVVVNSPAWKAGLRAGDKILSIDGSRQQTWNEMEDALKLRAGETLDVVVDRNGAALRIPVAISKITAKNPYGEDEEVGGIKGINVFPLATMVGVSDNNSKAYLAGIRTGDVITKIDGKSAEIYGDINSILKQLWKPGLPISITATRQTEKEAGGKSTELSFLITLPPLERETVTSPVAPASYLGLYPSELFVKQVTADSPAAKGGLLAGDRIVEVGGSKIYNFDSIVDEVQVYGKQGAAATFVVERQGKRVVLHLRPVEKSSRDPLTQEMVKKFLVGFVPNTAFHDAELTKVQFHEPLPLLKHSLVETFTLAKRMLISLAKLAIGKISVKNLGGPVLIASVAGKSLNAGVIPFLQMMALISINLFLLNLFPVPILDGGHLFFFLIEAIRGKPVSLKTMEIATQVGMVLILTLVALTLFNDISRIVTH